jgi:DNA primase
MKQITAEHLKSLRNDVDVAQVIQTLEIPLEHRGARMTFRCPDCARFHTALSPQRNRAHCFRCARSFNTIDLVMAERGCTFLEAVALLECLLS